MKILVSDKLSDVGLAYLREQDDVELTYTPGMPPETLAEEVGSYDGIIIRSGTKLTAEVLAGAGNLKGIARAGVGVDNIDVPAATAQGVIVMNTPGGNTVSTGELALTLMLALSRKIVLAADSLREGRWDRKLYQGTQLAGKTLGVIGLGRIGKALAARAVAMQMKVLGYDPMLSPDAAPDTVELVGDVDALYRRADYISVHVPVTDATSGMIAAAQFEQMKPNVRLVNAARGGIIDEAALLTALNDGKVAGAALDVYTREPPAGETLAQLVAHPNVLAVPHLGASTEEAQELVALEAAEILVEALRGGEIRNALNVPGGTRVSEHLKPFVVLASRLGTLMACITPGGIKKVEVTYRGGIAEMAVAPVTTALTIGLLQPVLGGRLNIVNAPVIAAERGIEIETTLSAQVKDFANVVEVTVVTDKCTRKTVGTIFGDRFPRIIEFDGFGMEMIPDGNAVIIFNRDKPGVIGTVGDVFGAAGVNIAHMTCGRKGDRAVIGLNLDSPPSEALLVKLREVDFITEVYGLTFEDLPEYQRGK